MMTQLLVALNYCCHRRGVNGRFQDYDQMENKNKNSQCNISHSSLPGYEDRLPPTSDLGHVELRAVEAIEDRSTVNVYQGSILVAGPNRGGVDFFFTLLLLYRS